MIECKKIKLLGMNLKLVLLAFCFLYGYLITLLGDRILDSISTRSTLINFTCLWQFKSLFAASSIIDCLDIVAFKKLYLISFVLYIY